VIVPLALLTLLLSTVWPIAANYSLMLTQWLVELLLALLATLMQYAVGSVTLVLPSFGVLASCLVGVLLLLTPRGLRLRWLSVPLLSSGVLFNIVGARVDDFELHVLDVGQGLAALVFTEHHTLLYDTGGRLSPQASMLDRVVLPFLHSRGRSTIDALVVSHADSDHSAGAADFQRHFPDARIMASDHEPPALSQSEACVAGDTWQWDDVHFSFLHPTATDFGTRNDLSCVLLVHSGSSRVLLTGDIEAHSEALLAERIGELPVTVMTAPHHGSRTSSTARFVDTVRPQHVVFAAGYRNAFGFPHPDVQMRYNLIGAQQHVTGTDGALVFRFDRHGLREPPSSYWPAHRRFWHRFSE